MKTVSVMLTVLPTKCRLVNTNMVAALHAQYAWGRGRVWCTDGSLRSKFWPKVLVYRCSLQANFDQRFWCTNVLFRQILTKDSGVQTVLFKQILTKGSGVQTVPFKQILTKDHGVQTFSSSIFWPKILVYRGSLRENFDQGFCCTDVLSKQILNQDSGVQSFFSSKFGQRVWCTDGSLQANMNLGIRQQFPEFVINKFAGTHRHS